MKSMTPHYNAEEMRPHPTMAGTYRSVHPQSVESELWRFTLTSLFLTGSGCLGNTEDYGPNLPRFGSSSLIVDCRQTPKTAQSHVAVSTRTEPSDFRARSVAEKLTDLAAALSLNKSQLAQVLRVTRPTVYAWLRGNEPGAANLERLHNLLGILARASVSGAAPLNARFVRQRPGPDEPSVLELLCEEELEPEQITEALKTARSLEEAADQKQRAREARLRARGFGEADSARRREQLARNVALKPWPR